MSPTGIDETAPLKSRPRPKLSAQLSLLATVTTLTLVMSSGALAQSACAQLGVNCSHPNVPSGPPPCDANCRSRLQDIRDANAAVARARREAEEAANRAYNQTWQNASDAFRSGNYALALQYYQDAQARRPGPSVAANILLVKGLMAWSTDPQAALTFLEQRRVYLGKYHAPESDQLKSSNDAMIEQLTLFLGRPQAAQRAAAEVAQLRQSAAGPAQPARIAKTQALADSRLAAWKSDRAQGDPAVIGAKRAAGALVAAGGGTSGVFGTKETGPVDVGPARQAPDARYANASAQAAAAEASGADVTKELSQDNAEGAKAASDCVFTGGGADCHAAAPIPVSHTDPGRFEADDLARKLGDNVASAPAVKSALAFYRNTEANTQVTETQIAKHAVTAKSTPEEKAYLEGLKLQLKTDQKAEADARGQVRAAVLNLGVAMP